MATGFTMTFDDSPRGVCKVCGQPAYAPQAKVCQEHRGQKAPRSSAASALDEAIARDTGGPSGAPGPDLGPVSGRTPGQAPGPGQGGSAPATTGDKAARVAYFQRQIDTELNPALVQGFAFLCRPVHPGNFYEVQGDRIIPVRKGEVVALSGMESWVLSHAAAELESSPMAKTAGAVAAPILPFALAAAGAALVGAKLYGLYRLREDIVKQWKIETGAEAPGAAQHADAAEQARAAQAAEDERRAQTVQAQEQAQAAQRAEQVQAETGARPGNSTRAEPLTDIDLGKPDAPAYDAADLPDVAGAAEAELSDLLGV